MAEYNSAGTLTRRYVHGDQVDEPWLQYNSNLVGVAYLRFLPLSSRHSRVAGVHVFNGSSAHEDDEAVIGSPAREDDEGVIGSPLREDDGQVRLKR